MLATMKNLVLAVFIGAASGHTMGAANHAQLRQGAKGFVQALGFKYKLRVCNAYPSSKQLTVFRGKDDLTKEALAYKTCADLKVDMKSDDKLDFKMDDVEAGAFTITDLPQNDAVLFLAVSRHDTSSATVSFESHVFSNLANAQVAVIDTYKGSANSAVKIQDKSRSKEGKGRSEELRYDSVVAVNPGIYECALEGSDGAEKARTKLVALSKESYIVMRVGVEAKEGKVYPQDIVAYPQSDDSSFSGATSWSFAGLLAVAVLLQ